LKIKRIIINNFMSIGHIDFTFENKLYLLNGINNDVLVDNLPTSNGAGKSAFTLSIIQCLFNRNPKSNYFENLNNHITSKPYVIKLYIEVKSIDYLISNDRNTLSIIVKDLTNDKVLSDRITESLIIIQDIIGLTYEEFVTLSYINQDTIGNLFSTDGNLILKYFDLTILDTYTRKAKDKRANLNSDIRTLKLRIGDITKSISVVNEDNLYDELDELNKDKEELLENHTYMTSKAKLTNDISILSEKLSSLHSIKKQVESSLQLLELSICPTCNRPLDNLNVDNLQEQLSDIEDKILTTSTLLSHKQESLTNLKDEFDGQFKIINDKIISLEAKIATHKHILSVPSKDIDKLQLELLEKEKELQIVKSLIKLLESGKVTTVYLHTFISGLNDNIEDILSATNNDFSLYAKIVKGKIMFNISSNGVDRELAMLSGGEFTILALTILTALFKTLEQQLNIIVPILVIDEAFNRIDKHNIKPISSLIDELKKNKNVIVIQHHNELPYKLFDEVITLTKEQGITLC